MPVQADSSSVSSKAITSRPRNRRHEYRLISLNRQVLIGARSPDEDTNAMMQA